MIVATKDAKMVFKLNKKPSNACTARQHNQINPKS